MFVERISRNKKTASSKDKAVLLFIQESD